MKGAGLFFRWSLFFVLILAATATKGPEARAEEKAGTQDIEELVRVIEDPEERKVLLERLRTLAAAREREAPSQEEEPVTVKKSLVGMEEIFGAFERLSTRLIGSAKRTGSLLAKAPDSLSNARDFLERPENRSMLFQSAVAVAAALFLALILK
ncbi:MAG: hypothetical protein ACLFUP_08125, partial [Desulfobacteraceae bacterium]